MVALTGVAGCGGRRTDTARDTGQQVSCEVDGQTRIGLATGNSTGVYYTLGNAYVQQVSDATGGDLKVTAAAKVRFIDATPLLSRMQAISVAYQRSTIPAATYRTPGDVPAIAVPNVLLVRNDLDANTACVLTRTLFERKDRLVRVNAAAAGIDLRATRQTEPVPLHRGAAAALDGLGAP